MSDQHSRATRHHQPAGKRSRLAVRSLRHGDVQTIELIGELDIEGAPLARRTVRDACDATGPHTLVLDLGGLTFMDSSGVHLIVEAHRRLGDDGRELVIARPPAHVRRLLELCGLIGILHVSEWSPAAVAEQARHVRGTQAAMAAAVRAMRSLDRQRLRPPR